MTGELYARKRARTVRWGADGKGHLLYLASGLPDTVLSEFRTRLVALTAEERFLEAVLDLCKERGWLKARGHQRTDSTHVLAKVRALNRTECVVETLRHGLNVLAVVAPDWGLRQVQPEWLERYGPRESRVSLSLGDRQTPAVRASGGPGWMGFDFLRSKRIPKVDFLLSIPAIDTDASSVEAKLLAARRRWNLDCRPGSVRSSEVILFPLRPRCESLQKTVNVLDWIQSAFHGNL